MCRRWTLVSEKAWLSLQHGDLLQGVILAGSISVLFDGDSSSSQPMLFFQLLLAYIGVNTGMTLVDLPQTSLVLNSVRILLKGIGSSRVASALGY